MAYALEALGKQVRLVNADAAPDHYREFPGRRADRDRQPDRRRGRCPHRHGVQRSRPHRRRLSRRSLHHQHRPPRRQPDVRRAELVRRIGRGVRRDGVRRDPRLGVPLSPEIATHIYLAILTDTGSFHHSNITPRTFDICRQTVEAGVEPGHDGPARLRQQQLRQAQADRRAPRRHGAHRRRTPGGPRLSTTRC